MEFPFAGICSCGLQREADDSMPFRSDSKNENYHHTKIIDRFSCDIFGWETLLLNF